MILVHSAPTSLVRDHGHPPQLGVLSSPRCVYMDAAEKGYKWAADCDAFCAWDEKRYVRMLERIKDLPGCLFVVAPDVVGDAAATERRFFEWLPHIQETGQPVAFVAQDGLGYVPWTYFDAFFIGGSTEFELSPTVATMVKVAKSRGKWVHMGRVNTRRRIRYAQSIGCDSIDGTNFSMYRKTNLPWALEMCAGGEQMRLTA